MSGYFDDSPCSGFEGPEKRLEIIFKANPAISRGLRLIGRPEWQEMCTLARCNILSQTSNEHFDSFVLSESSLFVYPTKVMIKTCGTTALLQAVPKILEFALRFNLPLAQVLYSRKNFLYPGLQPPVHQDWANEVDQLDLEFDGSSYVFGSTNQDHWHLYFADYTDGEMEPSIPIPGRGRNGKTPITLEIMMQKLDRTVASEFYRKEGMTDNQKFPGMASLLGGDVDATTDEFNFTPCGYSMNGLKDEAYMTIHVTPEAHCSYASFETNASLSPVEYHQLIGRVLSVFKPGKATLTMISAPESQRRQESSSSDSEEESNSSSEDNESGNSSDDENVKPAKSQMGDLEGYVVKYKTMTEVDGERTVIMCNLESNEYAALQSKNRPKSTTRRVRKGTSVRV
eukprot:TRINITY_DN426_c0_g1_i1.p1 TRINITY_DN426_c0_g1~~TRINITY_DN426_c0_g1_i1.p1  ORF type:complete len:399 (-),score=115.41 TRINITY_DN426_c0_g1_i1:168-1364(-)